MSPFRHLAVPKSCRTLILAMLCLCVMCLALCTPSPAGVTTRVSVASDGTQGNGDSYYVCASADGRYVAFASAASNLVDNDSNGVGDVFLRDRLPSTTERISVSTGWQQGNDWCWSLPSISADGRYVAFDSDASKLVSGDTNGTRDVFIRDRVAGTTERVSVSSTGEEGNDGGWGPTGSRDPSISADGRYVAFMSTASNLVPGDTNRSSDVFVRDSHLGRTERVSISSNGGQGNCLSGPNGLSIGADGRYVAFMSNASNLVAGDTNGESDVFIRDRVQGTTDRVSVSSSGEQANDESYRPPSISGDGRYVAFMSCASNLVPGDTNGKPDIFVRDRVQLTTSRVSISSNGQQGNGPSEYSHISADGRYVAFTSYSSNLVPGDTNATYDIFVRDRLLGVTERASVSTGGAQGNQTVGECASVSAEGRYVAFYSYASLVADDTNGKWDVFVRDRSGSESLPDLPITDFTLTPGTIGLGSSVTASVVAPGSTSARLRLAGLTRDVPPIEMFWSGSAWTATISGLLTPWASADVLTVWADVFDGTGRSGTACRLLTVVREAPPDDPGIPNAVWVDESNARGIVTGEVTEIPIDGTTPPPLQARVSLDTVVTSLLGVDGSMNLWPEVSRTGALADPAADYSLGSVLARIGFFSPSGGPAYDVTFNAVGEKAAFSAHFGPDSMLMTVWDLVAQVVAGAIHTSAPSAADLAETYAAFAELAPVKNAVGHLYPWPPGWQLPSAAAQFTWDLSELVRNDYERATLQYVLEKLFRRKISGLEWVRSVNALLTPYNMLKILRDEAVWAVQTADGDPVIVFTAWHRPEGLVGVLTEGGGGGLVRPAGMDVSFDLAESGGNWSYEFTVDNTEGASLWEWRVGLDGDQPQPTNVSAPPGWNWDVVWTMDERCVRFWTEGPNGWAAGDFGSSAIAEGASLSGFSFTLPYRLQQCSFTAMGTDMRMDGGMLSMVPALSAAPPDFAPTEGETTELQAYLDRPATASLKVYFGGTEYITVSADESRPAGEFVATWDGKDSEGQPAAPGDYEARLHVVYSDGSTADLSIPLTIVTGLAVDSIGELRSLPDGRQVRLVGKATTMGTSGSPSFIYVEEPDRCAGVKVMTSDTVDVGDVVSVCGAVSILDGERAITDATLTIVSTDGTAPSPLAMPNNRLGGTGSGIAGSAGLYNIGLLITTWGKVTQVGDGYLYLDDGSALKDGTSTGETENVGVRVICDPTGYAPGDYLEVTGISSCFRTPSGDIARRILTRTPADVRPLSSE